MAVLHPPVKSHIDVVPKLMKTRALEIDYLLHLSTILDCIQCRWPDNGDYIMVLVSRLGSSCEVAICRVLNICEGDNMPEVGESDMGLFSLSRDAYSKLLPTFAQEVGRGATTQERNFLPFIPWLRGRGNVRTFPAQAEIESVGINTLDELEKVGSYLRHG